MPARSTNEIARKSGVADRGRRGAGGRGGGSRGRHRSPLMARKQFLLRVDPELWKELERWAADDLRSVNAQVEWLLREAVGRRKRAGRDRSGRDAPAEPDGDHAARSARATC
jgi:hypothetical protein